MELQQDLKRPNYTSVAHIIHNDIFIYIYRKWRRYQSEMNVNKSQSHCQPICYLSFTSLSIGTSSINYNWRYDYKGCLYTFLRQSHLFYTAGTITFLLLWMDCYYWWNYKIFVTPQWTECIRIVFNCSLAEDFTQKLMHKIECEASWLLQSSEWCWLVCSCTGKGNECNVAWSVQTTITKCNARHPTRNLLKLCLILYIFDIHFSFFILFSSILSRCLLQMTRSLGHRRSSNVRCD